jgi:hypothetical protein
MSSEDRARDEAALDAAQQQARASGTALLEEHLRRLAQQAVDEELDAVRAAGVWSVDESVSFEVTIRRAMPPSPP